MIARYNRIQILRAAWALVLGLLCLYLTYLFFRYIPPFVAHQFGSPLQPRTAELIAGGGVLLTIICGHQVWRTRGGLFSYHESAFYQQYDFVSGGAVVVDHYVHRVTAPAYVIAQIMLAGPLQVLRTATLIASLLPSDTDSERRHAEALAALKAANKWQSIAEYPEMRLEILHLAQMGLIDFSAHKGVPRIKAR